jgi:diphthamide biosynthesis protein 7
MCVLLVEMTSPSTWYSWDTQYSACSVETATSQLWGCVLATGTYQVNKVAGESDKDEKDEAGDSPETERLGRIYLHTVKKSESGSVECEKVFSVDCPAVLDMKWSSADPEPRLAVADAAGFLTVYKLGGGETCELIKSGDIAISEGLALALEWSVNDDTIVVSDSKGCVTVVRVGEEGLEIVSVLAGHSYEAWTCCFSKHDPNLLYSGGDDCVFNFYDLRVDSKGPVKKNSKTHLMGVTSMVSNTQASCEREWELWTGSYDETVRLWDVRNMRGEVGSVGVGGGVWRIKQRGTRLLVGAMHNGFKVIEGQDIVEEYDEHESLAYGADWVKGMEIEVDNVAHDVIATCSFYDHLLKVWSVPRG